MQDLITGQAGAVTTIPDYAKGDSGLGDLGGEAFPRLTFKANRFRVTKGGDEEVLADTELDVIILAANPTVSRIYYAGTYDPDSGTGERPTCASADGEVPLANVASPMSDKCMTCPMNEKGSAISDDGGKRKACGYFHRLVTRLVKYPDLGEVVAEVKAMSLFGTSYPDRNLLNFRHYADRLNQHQTMAHAVITRMSFDLESSVPKILFQPIGYVAEEEFRTVIHPLATSAEVLTLADTSSMRTGNADSDAPPAPDGFRDKLMGETAPAHAQIAPPATTEPAPAKLSPEEQKIAGLQAQIAAMQTPAKVTAPAASPLADAHSNVNVHGVMWNAEYHATSSETNQGILNADGHWRARRGLSAELVAKGKIPTAATAPAAVASVPAPAPPEPVAEVESTEFDKGWNEALAEFDT